MSSSTLRINGPRSDEGPAQGLTLERLRTIFQDSHLNFLLGAGASAPYFAPLGDVENVLTKIRPDNGPGTLARTSIQGYFFDRVVQPNLAIMSPLEAEPRALIKSYAALVGTLNRLLLKRRSSILSKQVNLFTTNVDMAFEVALELLDIDTNDGFAGKIKPRLDLGSFGTLRFRQGARFEYRSEIPVFNLLKLHGSVGWRLEDENIHFDHRLGLVQEITEARERARQDLLPIELPHDIDADALLGKADSLALTTEGKRFKRAYDKMQIVNPEKTKFASTVLNKTYYELLRRFTNDLEKENSALVVHGFSFRDEHILDLALRAAATNPTLQIIVFCYSRRSADDISRLFPEEKVKNGNILLVQPHLPSEGETERKLTLERFVEDYLKPLLAPTPSIADHVIDLRIDAFNGVERDV